MKAQKKPQKTAVVVVSKITGTQSSPETPKEAIKRKPTNDFSRVATHDFPMSFATWLKRPFMSHYTSLQSRGGKIDRSTRLFQLSEKETQELASNVKKKFIGKKFRTVTSRSDRKDLLKKLQDDITFPEVFRRCQDGDDAMLAALGNQVVRHCEHIFLLAEGGNPVAAKYLAELAIKSTKGLERVVANHYEDLRGLAGIEYAWPVMMSPVKSLSSAPPEWTNLGLGKALNMDLNKRRRVKLNTPAGRLAWQLLNYIANLRYYCASLRQPGDKKPNGIPPFEYPAAGLPELTKDSKSIDEWWKVAERCLREYFRSCTDAKSKAEQEKVLCGIVTAAADRGVRYRFEARIIGRVCEEFHSVAGFQRSYAKTKRKETA